MRLEATIGELGCSARYRSPLVIPDIDRTFQDSWVDTKPAKVRILLRSLSFAASYKAGVWTCT